MIADQTPGIDTHLQGRQLNIGQRLSGQGFQQTAKVITYITQGAGAEWQGDTLWPGGRRQRVQRGTQAGEGGLS